VYTCCVCQLVLLKKIDDDDDDDDDHIITLYFGYHVLIIGSH